MPDDLRGPRPLLSDTYFCNFSLFQSMPDSWAIKQLFPVMPIHRLNEQPTRHAVLSDITCDCDGKIDQFIDRRDVKRTLQLHHVQRPAVLPGRVSDRGVSGNPRRPAQPVRRHEHGARRSERRGRSRDRGDRQGRHGARSARLRPVRATRSDDACRRRWKRPCARGGSITSRRAAS